MFRHFFQIYLIVILLGGVILVASTWIDNYRYPRAARREDVARAFAQRIVLDRVLNGEYDRCPLDGISEDYEILRMVYLEYN